MKRAALLLALTATFAVAQTGATSPASQVQDLSPQLPALIGAAHQVVLYAPDLSRTDVAEAVRLAITQRGTKAYLITTSAPLMYDDSLTLRLALMLIPTYLTQGAAGAGLPFVLLDGRALVGPGVTGPGSATWASGGQAASLAAWVKVATRQKPINVVDTVRQWVKEHGGPTLK